MKIEGLHFEDETTWDNVWQAWLEREGTREDWQQVAREKGWQSWEEWRDVWVRNFGAQTRQWLRYTILKPLETMPNFRVGPTQSWQKNFPAPKEFIGIIMPDKSIVDIEGHHRATALATAAQQGKEMPFQNLPTIALTPFKEGEETLLDTMLARGSTKERPK